VGETSTHAVVAQVHNNNNNNRWMQRFLTYSSAVADSTFDGTQLQASRTESLLLQIRMQFRNVVHLKGRYRKLHNEQDHNLYSSLNIIRVVILGKMGWAGHVERMGGMNGAYKVLDRKYWKEKTTCKT
jgi:hypothetical protein